ncbi:hypothetical protein H310_14852 [Aphanomyces invadans]|uniref:Reverse transcriptase RNase H-like domain-containing protein n=1 Tax=Aphanomyces invadans TaxID=157072 RepID=A0A024T9S3_9STRA|nr:hypothetical protein H310_14852 [Aphanomyces invadans]ETV90361.1 hypothetical protein H310_14852 [Aphanomyces invadans]|eukprot:XP_008881016.1 hypothetical protein H310_14852 [Aphanomyces invadans]
MSARMARWLSFYAEYNFSVQYKPGKDNVLADALSRRPDYSSPVDFASIGFLHSDLHDRIRTAYSIDASCSAAFSALTTPEPLKSRRLPSLLHRYSVRDGLLYFQPIQDTPPRIAHIVALSPPAEEQWPAEEDHQEEGGARTKGVIGEGRFVEEDKIADRKGRQIGTTTAIGVRRLPLLGEREVVLDLLQHRLTMGKEVRQVLDGTH